MTGSSIERIVNSSKQITEEKLMTNQELQNEINKNAAARNAIIEANKVDVDFKPAIRTFNYRTSAAIKSNDACSL